MQTVKFVQQNCTPCKMLGAFMQHAGLKADRELDINESEFATKLAKDLGVMSTPTIMLLEGDIDSALEGKEVKVEVVDFVTGQGQSKITDFFSRINK